MNSSTFFKLNHSENRIVPVERKRLPKIETVENFIFNELQDLQNNIAFTIGQMGTVVKSIHELGRSGILDLSEIQEFNTQIKEVQTLIQDWSDYLIVAESRQPKNSLRSKLKERFQSSKITINQLQSNEYTPRNEYTYSSNKHKPKHAQYAVDFPYTNSKFFSSRLKFDYENQRHGQKYELSSIKNGCSTYTSNTKSAKFSNYKNPLRDKTNEKGNAFTYTPNLLATPRVERNEEYEYCSASFMNQTKTNVHSIDSDEKVFDWKAAGETMVKESSDQMESKDDSEAFARRLDFENLSVKKIVLKTGTQPVHLHETSEQASIQSTTNNYGLSREKQGQEKEEAMSLDLLDFPSMFQKGIGAAQMLKVYGLFMNKNKSSAKMSLGEVKKQLPEIMDERILLYLDLLTTRSKLNKTIVNHEYCWEKTD